MTGRDIIYIILVLCAILTTAAAVMWANAAIARNS